MGVPEVGEVNNPFVRMGVFHVSRSCAFAQATACTMTLGMLMMMLIMMLFTIMHLTRFTTTFTIMMSTMIAMCKAQAA